MRSVCCIDCDWCYDETSWDRDCVVEIRYYCQRGTFMKEIEEPEIQRDCPDFVPFVDDV